MELTYEATATETSAPDVVELALIGKPNALSLFQSNGLDQILDKIRSEVALHVPDISSERGRKAIASLARKVASSKVRLDDLGKELARLQKLEAERQQFEREERIRVQAAAEAKAAAEARALEEAQAAEKAANAVHERIRREKAEAEVRAAKAEASRLDAIEAAERARVAEETRQRKEAARVEFERIEAEAAREAAEKRHVEEMATAERKAQADQQAAIEAERRRVAEAQRVEEEAAAKREANKKHRTTINRAAVAALIANAGITEDMAIAVVTVIAHGKVPNVTISY
jgi:colicin import membrane protein